MSKEKTSEIVWVSFLWIMPILKMTRLGIIIQEAFYEQV